MLMYVQYALRAWRTFQVFLGVIALRDQPKVAVMDLAEQLMNAGIRSATLDCMTCLAPHSIWLDSPAALQISLPIALTFAALHTIGKHNSFA